VRIEVGHHVVVEGEGEIGLDTLRPGEYVSVAVCDNGIGMTEDVQARAFEPFFSTKGPGAGTGLGLSQTYGFVSQSGGTVRIESAPGQGTRITMLLPRALHAAANTAKPPPLPARDGSGEHILLVEDDALLRQTMADALRGRGYTVSTAADGPQALRMLDDDDTGSAFALLFTDVVMPGGLTGVDVALQARKRRSTLPVLFATGYSSAAILDAWPEKVDLLAKPYSPEEVAARIAARLEVREVV
jgi:CheY-like chemotaxis protein